MWAIILKFFEPFPAENKLSLLQTVKKVKKCFFRTSSVKVEDEFIVYNFPFYQNNFLGCFYTRRNKLYS